MPKLETLATTEMSTDPLTLLKERKKIADQFTAMSGELRVLVSKYKNISKPLSELGVPEEILEFAISSKTKQPKGGNWSSEKRIKLHNAVTQYKEAGTANTLIDAIERYASDQGVFLTDDKVEEYADMYCRWIANDPYARINKLENPFA